MIVIGLLMTPISISYAETIQQNQKVQVKLTLDESLVDLPIDELKQKEIIIEVNMQGRYIVHLTNESGKKVKQVVTRAEALQLGFVDDIMDLPKGKEIISIEIVNDDYYAVIRNEDGSIIKQKITNEEAEKISAQLQKEKDKHLQEETDSGEFPLPEEGGADQGGSKAEKEKSGLSLPETATNVYNLLLIGVVLLITGFVIRLKKINIGSIKT